ncbi:MAG: DUF1540 domain-containing protein [Clostridia bacterium]|nr:DUF1540 domain-containing protein [Clostridia bacterium]
MDNKQKINCTVNSCKYNNCDSCECTLNQITVEPIDECETCTPDESMCGSYEYNEQDDDE